MGEGAKPRRVLVTGASRGIGRAVALALGRAGFEVALNYRTRSEDAEAVRARIEESGGRAHLLGFDVSDRESCSRVLAAELARRGPFWGVVLNAGITRDAPLASLAPEDWDRVLTTNLDSFQHVLAPLIMPMVRLRDGGRIVTMSSTSGLHGNRGQTHYAASKAGLIGATKSLALELAKRAITVNAVAPGYIATEMVAGLPADVIERVPLGRMGEPGEVADLVAFLFSEGGRYITGQVLEADGGLGLT